MSRYSPSHKISFIVFSSREIDISFYEEKNINYESELWQLAESFNINGESQSFVYYLFSIYLIICIIKVAPVAHWIERLFPKQKVVG